MRSVWRYVLNLPAPRGGPPPFQSGFPRVVPPVICRILPLFALRHDWSPLYAIFLDALVTGPATSVVPSRGGHLGFGYASHRATAHRFFSSFFLVPCGLTHGWSPPVTIVPSWHSCRTGLLPSWRCVLVAGPTTSVVPSRGGHSGSGYASYRATAHRSLLSLLVNTMWPHARVVAPRAYLAVMAFLPYWPLAVLAFPVMVLQPCRPSFSGWYSPSRVAWRPLTGRMAP